MWALVDIEGTRRTSRLMLSLSPGKAHKDVVSERTSWRRGMQNGTWKRLDYGVAGFAKKQENRGRWA